MCSSDLRDQKFSDDGKPKDIVTEYFAKQEDIKESEKWQPYSNLLDIPMRKVIEVAYENIKTPDTNRIYEIGRASCRERV